MTDCPIKPLILNELKQPLVLILPMPPSVNALYSTNFRTKRRFASKAYEGWAAEAGWKIKPQIAPHPRPCIPGPVSVTYEFARFPDRRQRDLLNFEKGLTDLLVKYEVIGDDSLIQEATLRWSSLPAGQARVSIKPFTEAHA